MRMLIFYTTTLLMISACGSVHHCETSALTRCVVGSAEQKLTARMILHYPVISKKAPTNGCVQEDYPQPFPFAKSIDCAYSKDDSAVSSVSVTKDVNGLRIYSCETEDGLVLLQYKSGENFATSIILGQEQQFPCEIDSTTAEL